MGKTYVFPEDVKALLIFEVNGEEMFISPIQQHDIRTAYQIYQSPQIAADMINLLQFRTGCELITPEMVQAVMARPLLPHPMAKPEAETKPAEPIAAETPAAPEQGASGAAEPVAAAEPEAEEPEPEEPQSTVVEDDETFDLWGQALHIPLALQQDIRCAYLILGSAEAAVSSLNRTKQREYGAPVTIDMVQAVITRLLRQEDMEGAH